MQTNILPQKISQKLSKVIEKLVIASGTLALVWILTFLLVAMIDK